MSFRRVPFFLRIACAVLTVWAFSLSPAAAKVFMTQAEALKQAFPGAELERESHFLTAEQKAAIKRSSGSDAVKDIFYTYTAKKDGRVVGTAFFDAHMVRTLPEVLMIVVTPDGKVDRIEVLSFKEPVDYIPPEKWYAQFDAKPLSDDLSLNRGVRNMTGATLTARATEQAVRRALAAHAVLSK